MSPRAASPSCSRQVGAVLFAEQTPPGDANAHAVLAHELGHSLGFLHDEGPDAAGNLTVAEISQNRETATGLAASQIEQARAQALAGDTLGP